MKDWDAVVATGLALPGVELGTTYGQPALKVRGKMIAATTAPEPGSFVLHVSEDEKAVLIETDPETFWETDHYRGWPAVLVRDTRGRFSPSDDTGFCLNDRAEGMT